MAQYKTGTVSVTNDSATVTGSGTAFSANLTAGNLFTVEGDNVAYTVASAPTATSLTLTAPYGGTTGAGKIYGVTIDFTPDLGLPLMSIGDLNTAAIYNEAMKNIDNAQQNLGTAAFADLTTSSTDASGGKAINSSYFKNFEEYGLGSRHLFRNLSGVTVARNATVLASSLQLAMWDATGNIFSSASSIPTSTWKNISGRDIDNNFYAYLVRVS